MNIEENVIMISATATRNLVTVENENIDQFIRAYHKSLQITKGRIPVFLFRDDSRMENLLVGYVRELNLKYNYIILEMPSLFEEFSEDTGTIPGFIFPHIERCFYTGTRSLPYSVYGNIPYFVYVRGEGDLVDKQHARSSTILPFKRFKYQSPPVDSKNVTS